MTQHAATAKHAPFSTHNNSSNKKGLRQAVYIFMVINTVFLTFAIIPMIWCIPMTIAAKKKIKNLNESVICLGIFTFLLTMEKVKEFELKLRNGKDLQMYE